MSHPYKELCKLNNCAFLHHWRGGGGTDAVCLTKERKINLSLFLPPKDVGLMQLRKKAEKTSDSVNFEDNNFTLLNL